MRTAEFLTHTGGAVSVQYLSNCTAQNLDVSNIVAGERLDVDNAYFSRAVSIVYEVGVKLCYTFWRKFVKAEHESANDALRDLTYDLIVWRAYAVAESLLRFGTDVVKRTRGNDRTHRMMIVNLANAVRLQGRGGEAKKILEKEDWSASNDAFTVSVAAVSGDIDNVVKIMKNIGPGSYPSAEDYRTWPVFRGIRMNRNFCRSL